MPTVLIAVLEGPDYAQNSFLLVLKSGTAENPV